MSTFRWDCLLNREFPSRPFYVYDLNLLSERYRFLKAALPSEFQILYSMKANPHHDILKRLKSEGAWVDICSAGEFQRAKEAGFLSTQMSFVGPGKTRKELELCVAENVFCVVESYEELLQLSQIANSQGRQQKVCLRINPSEYLNHQGRQIRQVPSQFGLDEEQAFALARESVPGVKVIGLHFFLHSQFLNSSILVKNFCGFTEMACRFQSELGRPLEILNFGGGFGVPYFPDQQALDLEVLKMGWAEIMTDSVQRELFDAQFFVETGRFLCAPAGLFVTEVLYKKHSRGQTYLICDGGWTQHLAATGVGQLVRRNFPVTVLKRQQDQFQISNETKTETVTIAGPSCYSMDVLGSAVCLPVVEVGDLLCFHFSGAYGPSFSPQEFLSRPMAQEIFLV